MTRFTLTSILLAFALFSSAILKADSLSINLDAFALYIDGNTEVGQVAVSHLVADGDEYLEVTVTMDAVDWVGGTTFIYAGTERTPLALKGNAENGHIPQGSEASIKEILTALEAGDYKHTATYTIPLNAVVTTEMGNFTLEIHTEVFELSFAGEGYYMTNAKTAKAAGASSIAAKIVMGTE